MTDNEQAKAMYRNTVNIKEITRAQAKAKEHSYDFTCEYDSGPDAIFAYYVDDKISDRIYIRASMKNVPDRIYRVNYRHLKSGTKEETFEVNASFLSKVIKNCGSEGYHNKFYSNVYSLRTGHKVYDYLYATTDLVNQFLNMINNEEKCAQLVSAVNANIFSMSGCTTRHYINVPEVNTIQEKLVKALVKATKAYAPHIQERELLASLGKSSSRSECTSATAKFYNCLSRLEQLVNIYGFDMVNLYFIKPWVEDSALGTIDWYEYNLTKLFGYSEKYGSFESKKAFEKYKNNAEAMAKDGYTPFDLKGLANYYLVTLKREGFDQSIRAAVELHSEVIDAQRQVYGRVKDKYPKYLDTFHRKIIAKRRILKNIEEELRNKGLEERFNNAMKESKKWEISYKGWFWRPFESKGELVDVADNILHNCLETSYLERIANQETEVILMFEKLDPETPKYAIEIKSDAFARDNVERSEYGSVDKYWIKQAYGDQIAGLINARLPKEARDALPKMLAKAVRKQKGILDEAAEARAEAEDDIAEVKAQIEEETQKSAKLQEKLAELQNNLILDDF